MKRALIITLALGCFHTYSVQAQDPLFQKRIVDLLNSTADEAKTWDDKAIAARTQAQIADLIWSADADIARNHLNAAWITASKVEDQNRERSAFVNPSLRNAVRRDVLLVA